MTMKLSLANRKPRKPKRDTAAVVGSRLAEGRTKEKQRDNKENKK